ncbi:MAG: hypothetical protein U9Q91_02375, partial [Candidatus Marinimicrobia bacterium]|nr:hypothetical protein [Candidatus Neomarinimicrobiota bacterium]
EKPQVGGVYLSNDIEINPQGPKMCICVHPAGLWFFLINSANRKMYDCIPVLKENNPFLNHDSYISTNLSFELKNNEFQRSKYLGRISETDIANILNKVNKSKILSLIQKEKIIDSISSWRISNTSS